MLWSKQTVAVALVATLAACMEFDRQAQPNTPPVVTAGDDQTVAGGALVTLSAEATDANDDPVTFRWQQVSGPTAPLSANDQREVTFEAPLANEVLAFEVRGHDGFDESEPDLVLVNVQFNHPPVADAGAYWSTPNLVPLRLRGAAQDAEADPIVAWQWTVISGPTGDLSSVLTGADTRLPTFSPTLKGTYTVELVVSDGQSSSAPNEAILVATNNPPVAVASFTQPQPDTFDLEASGSFDPDGEAIATYRWSVVSPPRGGSVSFVGAIDAETAQITVTGSGTFEVALVVGDGEGAESEPTSLELFVNRAPLLSLNGTTFVAGSGDAFDLDASSSADPDGDTLIISWTKTSGDSAFPDGVVGTRPLIVAPSYSAILAADGSNAATYEVVATDGLDSTLPQTVTLYAAPPLSEYVIVSNSFDADDTGACGSVYAPCATIARALQLITGGTTEGDGRTLLMTTGSFTDTTDTAARTWPAGVDILGGISPATWLPSGERTAYHAELLNPNCISGYRSLTVPASVDAEFRGVSFTATTPCSGALLRCEGCRVRLVDSQLGLFLSVAYTTALYVGNGGKVELDRSLVRTGPANVGVTGIDVDSAQLTMRDSAVVISGASGGTTGIKFNTGCSVVIERSSVEQSGSAGSFISNVPIYSSGGGNLLLRNVVVRQQLGGRPAIRVYSATIINSTILATTTAASVIRVEDTLDMMNSLVIGGDVALDLATTAGRSSRIFANALEPDGTTVLHCRDAGNTTDINLSDPSDLSACDDTTSWTGNIAGLCPLADTAAGNLHLNVAVANPCVDSGVASSPFDVAPDDDIDGESRPQGAGPDIGADEAG